MPRLPSSLLRRARNLHPLLPQLLCTCRDIGAARNELRWLREHAINLGTPPESKSAPGRWRRRLRQLCHERSKGRPLQYILGSQPFGNLEILCRKGVLIPRPETESLTSHTASFICAHPKIGLRKDFQTFRILDLCTGTGCIPLLLHSLLSHHIPDIQISGVDISSTAVNTARSNLEHNIRLGHLEPCARQQISFVQDDIFEETGKSWRKSTWDVLISNPPYVSPKNFDSTTSHSVRNYEPKTALVPTQSQVTTGIPVNDDDTGDAFYPRLLQIAHRAGAQVLLVEVADMAQASRVVKLVVGSRLWSACEVWRDFPAQNADGNVKTLDLRCQQVKVRGEGHGRAVLAWGKDRAKLLHEE